MDLQLTGKRALVTGSNSGIGTGIARTLAAEGALVVIHGRSIARCETVVAELLRAGGEASFVAGDLADAAACATVCDSVIERFGGIDILVNNAGGRASAHRMDGEVRALNTAWLDTPWADWAWTFEQNVGAAVRLIQRLVPGMKERKWGRVINIASAAATQTEQDLSDYQATKAAMVNISASLAKTLSHTGITVNTVSPGAILTPGLIKVFTDTAVQMGWNTSDWDEIERRFTTEIIPISTDHFGKPEDIGRMVTFLASPLSAYMTGANYRVDGGQIRTVN